MSQVRFSFVVVTYSSADTIGACLSSIAAWTSDSFEVVVVDNSPNQQTLFAVREFMTLHPNVPVRVIDPGANLGFSRACNLGAGESIGEFLFFLNPDTKLMNDAGKSLAHCLKRQPGAMAAGPAIFDGLSRVTRTCRNLPGLGRTVLDATGVDNWLGAYKLTRFRHDSPRQVEQIIGAAILVRRSDYERLGGMDERFFVYFEEVDFCKRLKEAGGNIWFWPEARIQHVGGASCESSPVRARMIFTLRESRKKYFKKHFGASAGAVLDVINRLEGLQKSVVLTALWILRRRPSDREKAYGFWAVATGIAPKV